MAERKLKLKRASSPEEVGVSSAAIKKLIEDFKKTDVEVHSLMILRHGKVAFESWAYPFTPDMPHIMYSVSKSFTSTAIGFAIEEGLLTLETKLVDIFPDYNKEDDEKLQKLTVFHLLTMTAGKMVSVLTDRTKNQWIKDFFDAPWEFAPGEGWEYISENQFMLSAIIKELTGKSLREYLAPRLFAPLGIRENPFWECDGSGTEAGGWGLHITTEELANFTQCLLDGGKFKGKRVIPAKWVKYATSGLVDNDGAFGSVVADVTSGYGACFWQNGVDRGYRADGMFSQFGFVFEKEDACMIVTACEISEQITRDCIWRHFDELFIKEGSKPTAKEIPSLDNLPELPKSKIRSRYEEVLKDKKITLRPSAPLEALKFPLSVLPMYTTFMSADKAGYYNNFTFDFEENECIMSWDEGEVHNSIRCSLEGTVSFSPLHLGGMDFTASASACWINETNLFVWVRPLGAIGQRRLRFEFNSDGSATLYSSTSPGLNKVAVDLSSTFTKKIKLALAKNIVSSSFTTMAPAFLEPKHKCKLEDR